MPQALSHFLSPDSCLLSPVFLSSTAPTVTASVAAGIALRQNRLSTSPGVGADAVPGALQLPAAAGVKSPLARNGPKRSREQPLLRLLKRTVNNGLHPLHA